MASRELSERVREILRCPTCRARLVWSADRQRCTSDDCAKEFPSLDDGTPVLIDESTSIFSHHVVRANLVPTVSPDSWRARIHRWLPDLERNVQGEGNFRRLGEELRKRFERPLVLNIAGKHPASCSRALRSDPSFDVVELDVKPGPATQLIADPAHLPFESTSFEGVIADAILEHCIDSDRCAQEIARVLRPGGLVYSDVPFMLPVHGGAFDFARFSPMAHRRLFRAFDELDSGVSQGPGAALAYSIQYFLLSFVERDVARFVVKAFSRIAFFWLKLADPFLARRPGARDAALGTYFLGSRRDTVLSDAEILGAYRGITPDLLAGRRSLDPTS